MLTALLATALAAAPDTVAHQGRLLDAAGGPLNEAHDLTFRLADAAGAVVWTETHPQVPLADGYYAVRLGAITPLGEALSAEGTLSIAVDGGAPLGPGLPVGALPWARRAATADAVAGPVDATVVRVNGTPVIAPDGTIAWGRITGAPADRDTLGGLSCTADQQPIRTASGWACEADSAHTHDAAAITSGRLAAARLPVARSFVGTLEIPVSYSGTPSAWTQANPRTAVGFAWGDYNEYLAPGQALQVRLCSAHTDSGDQSGELEVRFRKYDASTVHWTGTLGNTWSASGLIHSDCTAWTPLGNLTRCTFSWSDTCAVEVRQTQARSVILYRMWWEISAL